MHGCKSPTTVHCKGNTSPLCKSLFAFEMSAKDHIRLNLKRTFCVKLRPSPPQNKGQRGGKRLGTQQTLVGVFGFAPQGNRVEKYSLAHSSRGANSRGGRGAGSKSLPAKRVFSDPSGQGGSATTSVHRLTGQASFHPEQAADLQTEGHVGAGPSFFR